MLEGKRYFATTDATDCFIFKVCFTFTDKAHFFLSFIFYCCCLFCCHYASMYKSKYILSSDKYSYTSWLHEILSICTSLLFSLFSSFPFCRHIQKLTDRCIYYRIPFSSYSRIWKFKYFFLPKHIENYVYIIVLILTVFPDKKHYKQNALI